MNWLKVLLGGPIELVAKAYEARQHRKVQERQIEDAKHARRIEVIKEGRVNEATWNQKSMENSSWRDEYITILLSIPVILIFGPDALQQQIADGFAELEKLPDWYKAGLGLMIGSAFGYQKYTNYVMNKAYALPSPIEDKV